MGNFSPTPGVCPANTRLIATVILVIGLASFFTASSASLQAQEANRRAKLTVKVTNIQTSGKTLYLGLYRATDQFPEFSKFWKNAKVTTDGTEKVFELDVPYGEYAIAVIHDLNGNGKLDTNFFGYPSEPFAFSRGFKPVLSGPDFADCKFNYSSTSSSITITLIY